MRRAMAAEAAAARARGETIDEKTTSEEEEEEEMMLRASEALTKEATATSREPASRDNVVVPRPQQSRPLRDPADFLSAGYDSDRGNEADMDDTSMSSRASSRLMGESM